MKIIKKTYSSKKNSTSNGYAAIKPLKKDLLN